MKRGAIFLKCVVAVLLAIFFFAWVTLSALELACTCSI